MMAAQPTRRPFTVAEYYRMGKAGILKHDERVELIEGEVIQMPPIGGPHASRVDRITRLFGRSLDEVAQIRVQGPLRLNDYTEPIPDVMLLRPRPDFYAAGHPTAADVRLLVEVADTSLAYDQRTKLPLYARHGVPEVWIVDVNRKNILVHREPSPTGYGMTETRQRGDPIAPSAFPQVSFAVDDILG
jgi:Uma2 family endonuclease